MSAVLHNLVVESTGKEVNVAFTLPTKGTATECDFKLSDLLAQFQQFGSTFKVEIDTLELVGVEVGKVSGSEEPVKRKPGRPKGSGKSAGASEVEDTTKRTPGRPKGSKESAVTGVVKGALKGSGKRVEVTTYADELPAVQVSDTTKPANEYNGIKLQRFGLPMADLKAGIRVYRFPSFKETIPNYIPLKSETVTFTPEEGSYSPNSQVYLHNKYGITSDKYLRGVDFKPSEGIRFNTQGTANEQFDKVLEQFANADITDFEVTLYFYAKYGYLPTKGIEHHIRHMRDFYLAYNYVDILNTGRIADESVTLLYKEMELFGITEESFNQDNENMLPRQKVSALRRRIDLNIYSYEELAINCDVPIDLLVSYCQFKGYELGYSPKLYNIIIAQHTIGLKHSTIREITKATPEYIRKVLSESGTTPSNEARYLLAHTTYKQLKKGMAYEEVKALAIKDGIKPSEMDKVEVMLKYAHLI